MKKLLALGMALLLLAACTAQVSPTPPNEPDAPQDDPTPVPAIVSVGYASDELLADTAGYDEFIDDQSEYQVKAAFTCNVAVEQFRYVELRFDDSDDIIRLEVAQTLYEAGTLTPERPLVIGMALMGAIPDRGISYLDENGVSRLFSVSMSGEDGSLLLSEITQ